MAATASRPSSAGLGITPEELADRTTRPPAARVETVPADPQDVAPRPARANRPPSPSSKPCSTTSPRVQPAPSAPVSAPPGDPGHHLHRPAQSRPPPTARADTHYRVRHDRDQRGRHRHPARRRPTSTTSASAEPTPEPTSSCSSTTSTYASSTPPPASSSASSPSTPTATTNATGRPPGPTPKQPQRPEPDAGSGCPRCLETSHGGPGRDRTCDRGIMSPRFGPSGPYPICPSSRSFVRPLVRRVMLDPSRIARNVGRILGWERAGQRAGSTSRKLPGTVFDVRLAATPLGLATGDGGRDARFSSSLAGFEQFRLQDPLPFLATQLPLLVTGAQCGLRPE